MIANNHKKLKPKQNLTQKMIVVLIFKKVLISDKR